MFFNEKKSAMAASSPPPPPYDDDYRPAHLWKLDNNDWSVLSPYQMPESLSWNRRANEVEWEMDFRSARKTFGMTKFSVTRGPAGSGPSAFTYKKFSRMLVSADKRVQIECKYDVNRATNTQSMALKSDQLPPMQWHTNEVISTVGGRMFDTTRWTLTDQRGTPLASFAWLLPDGRLDWCMQFTPAYAQLGLPDEIALLTLNVFMYDQWTTMVEEFGRAGIDQRTATIDEVGNSLHLEGRRINYSLGTRQDADNLIGRMRAQFAEDQAYYRRQSANGSINTTTTVMASTM